MFMYPRGLYGGCGVVGWGMKPVKQIGHYWSQVSGPYSLELSCRIEGTWLVVVFALAMGQLVWVQSQRRAVVSTSLQFLLFSASPKMFSISYLIYLVFSLVFTQFQEIKYIYIYFLPYFIQFLAIIILSISQIFDHK